MAERITPAHAGNSVLQVLPDSGNEDHPRTCGEQVRYTLDQVRSLGSPPHMRGTDEASSASITPQGITPAHAGNSD